MSPAAWLFPTFLTHAWHCPSNVQWEWHCFPDHLVQFPGNNLEKGPMSTEAVAKGEYSRFAGWYPGTWTRSVHGPFMLSCKKTCKPISGLWTLGYNACISCVWNATHGPRLSREGRFAHTVLFGPYNMFASFAEPSSRPILWYWQPLYSLCVAHCSLPPPRLERIEVHLKSCVCIFLDPIVPDETGLYHATKRKLTQRFGNELERRNV